MGIVLTLGVVYRATADYELPPRAAPPPVDVQTTGGDTDGGRVHLRGYFSNDWPWEEMHWQEGVWHVVQWSDHAGGWHDVDGWSGSFDAIHQEAAWVGQKALWAAPDQLGKGPFRWLVSAGPNGRLLAVSDEFYLPAKSSDLVIVNIDLAP